ncbi:hypothetical protein NEHOM01_1226 [Nematocida homosporus]|uniref:uncharacterized protein n=1 Tax=Nematocida homosporus TaxID=1912981 RepID=UPI00221F109C|nr:uncharacterized protein NEHOM01_1226 [Nematocida homosporus]KAI5186023.1 hypothetical protein NEHOM01_1226 [Nematocida homosporus]
MLPQILNLNLDEISPSSLLYKLAQSMKKEPNLLACSQCQRTSRCLKEETKPDDEISDEKDRASQNMTKKAKLDTVNDSPILKPIKHFRLIHCLPCDHLVCIVCLRELGLKALRTCPVCNQNVFDATIWRLTCALLSNLVLVESSVITSTMSHQQFKSTIGQDKPVYLYVNQNDYHCRKYLSSQQEEGYNISKQLDVILVSDE